MACALSADPISVKLEDNLQCSECQEKLRNPRTLPCFHSFCKVCLENVVETCREEAAPGRRIREFHCPSCREKFVLEHGERIADMPPNHFICNMLEAAAVLDRGTSTDVPCSHNCSEGYSVAHCVTCEKFLCRECLTDHNRWRGNKEHTVLPMDEFSKPENLLNGKVYCKEPGHKDKALKYYCETCDSLICKQCMDSKHQRPRHICHVVKEVAHKNRELVAASNDNLGNLLAKGDDFLQRLSFFSEAVDVYAQDAKSLVAVRKETLLKQVSDVLEKRSKNLMAEIDELQGDKHRMLKNHTKKTNTYVSHIRRCVQISAKLLEGTDEEIISSQKTMHHSEQTILAQSSKYFKDPVTYSDFYYSHCDESEVTQIADILGKAMGGLGEIVNESASPWRFIFENPMGRLGEVYNGANLDEARFPEEQEREESTHNTEPLAPEACGMAIPYATQANFCSNRSGFEAIYEGCKLITYQGDINKEKVDAIVMPISSQCHEKVKNFGPVNLGDVVIAEAQDLPCKMVLHVIGFIEEGLAQSQLCCDDSLVRKIIFNSLVLATRHNAESISMPAVARGLSGMDVEVYALTTLEVVEKFLEERSHFLNLDQIRFVNDDEQTSSAFAAVMRERYQAVLISG